MSADCLFRPANNVKNLNVVLIYFDKMTVTFHLVDLDVINGSRFQMFNMKFGPYCLSRRVVVGLL